jgi:hypothetical protein
MKTLGKAALLALPFLMLAQGAPATQGDLKLTKIALHLSPDGPPSCSQVIPSRCSDAWVYDAGFRVVGAADTWYALYILATDINTTVGLKRVSFKIEYDPGVAVWDTAPLYLPEWCASATLTPDAFASGTTIDIEFPTCVGVSPDPADPEGDGTVLLGTLVIRGSGKFAIGGLDTNERAAQLVNCAGETTELAWRTADISRDFVALGEIGLGPSFGDGNVHGACTFPEMFDDPCAAGWSSSMYACCNPGVGCAGGLSQFSERACDYVGGVWSVVRCRWACNDEDCMAVPVRLTTWGAIKSMYD